MIRASIRTTSLPNGLFNAILAETVAARRLDGIPQSHEADGTLVFTLQGRVELDVVALLGRRWLETGRGVAAEGARALWAQKGLPLLLQHRQRAARQLSAGVVAVFLQTPLAAVIASHLGETGDKVTLCPKNKMNALPVREYVRSSCAPRERARMQRCALVKAMHLNHSFSGIFVGMWVLRTYCSTHGSLSSQWTPSDECNRGRALSESSLSCLELLFVAARENAQRFTRLYPSGVNTN